MKSFLKRLRKVLMVLAVSAAFLTLAGYAFMQKASFGKSPSGERLARIIKSSHYRDGAFQNRIETPMYPEGSSTLSVMAHFTFDKTEHTEPEEAIPSIKRDLRTKPLNESPVVTWFGHSTTLVQIGGQNILTDPVFSKRASPVSWAPLIWR